MFTVEILNNRTRGHRLDYLSLANGDYAVREPLEKHSKVKQKADKVKTLQRTGTLSGEIVIADGNRDSPSVSNLTTADNIDSPVVSGPVENIAEQNSKMASGGGDKTNEKGETQHPPNSSDDAAEDMAARIAALEAKNNELVKQKEALAREAELRKWEKANSELELEITKMELDRRKKEVPTMPPDRRGRDHRRQHRGGVSGADSDSSAPENIQKLRQLDYLQRKAEEELQQWGLESEQETEGEGAGSSRGMLTHKRSRKSKKSPIPFPQEYLGFEYVANIKTYEDLDIRLFVAGELGVMSRPNISRSELEGRRDLLKILMYHAGNYQWRAVKNLYSVIIDSIYIQKDRKWDNWDYDLARLETMMLMSYALPKGESVKSNNPKKEKSKSNSSNYKYDNDEVDNQTWYCTAYNKGNCKHNQPHNHFVAGKTRVVQHICATCHKKKEFANHREKTADCPYNN